MKYCVWIIPPQPVFDELNKIIRDLSAEYKGPVLKPHMTLLGSTECELDDMQKAVETVAKNTKKLDLTLGAVSFSTTYYQSVLVRVEPSAKLMQLNLDLKKQLGVENKLYMPHISLMYGDHDMKTREQIAKKIKLQNASFIADSIVIVPVAEKSDPKDWNSLTILPLVG